jgi:hypothetical protein
MSIQKRNVCHVRFLQDLKAGEVARYVVLITAGDCTDASIECESTDGRLNAKVTAYGETDVLVVT